MFKVPVTYMIEIEELSPKLRKYVFEDFAANGMQNIVLCDGLIRQIMQRPKLADEIRAEMQEAGLKFVDSHAPYGEQLDLSWPGDEAMRKMLVLRHKIHLELAASFGVDTMTIHLGNDNMHPEVTLEKHNDYIREALEQLLPVAEKCGVVICIENIWSRLTTPENLNSFIDYFRNPWLGLCYDAGHANIMDNGRLHPDSIAVKWWKAVGVDVPQWDDHVLEKMLPNVVNCHLHGNDGRDDMHRNVDVGNVKWTHIIPLLNQAPRLRSVQSEVIPIRTATSLTSIKRQFDWLDSLD